MAAAAAVSVFGCSTTKRLAEGEVLYTGVRKIVINADSSGIISSTAEDDIKEPLSVQPNNPLFSPYVRTPLPTGLWAYNSLYTEKTKGFKHWLFKTLGKEPVLMSKVQPELRVQLVEAILANHGYFGSTASYEIHPKKKPGKARLSYNVSVAKPWYYSSVVFPRPADMVTRKIDSLSAFSKLKVGDQYDVDTLAAERDRITRVLRNEGYYFFRPNFIEYKADTSRAKQSVDLRMIVAPQIPQVALRPYSVRNTYVTLKNIRPEGRDTLNLRGGRTVIHDTPLKVRPRVLARAITFRRGDLFTLRTQTRTQSNFSKLGVFRSVNLSVSPLDSLRGKDSLDVYIDAAMGFPMEAEFQVNLTSKSSSFLGPGLSLKLSHNNLFRGGEVLSLYLNGSYEWQTGSRNSAGANSSLINSYEFGITPTLTIPRLWFPGFFQKSPRYSSSTRFMLSFDLLNRPKFFRMLSLSWGIGYDFQTSRSSFHNLSILKLTYNRLFNTTAEFDSTMAVNPAIAQSFENQLIPAVSYTYTYDKSYSRSRFFWQGSFTSAGNMLDAGLGLLGKPYPKILFGNQFSQFVKATSELKYYQSAGSGDNQMVYRFMIGAGHAYGNARVMPYAEQFYTGGANSNRAFTIRSFGPGSYYPTVVDRNTYLDQTGTFKLEANLEYRFGIFGGLKGALFADAGNIWLLKDDPDRPGAKLRAKNLLKELATSAGAGLRFDITYLVLRLDMGVALHTPYPNPDKSGYYNISKFRDGLGFQLAIGYPF